MVKTTDREHNAVIMTVDKKSVKCGKRGYLSKWIVVSYCILNNIGEY